VELFLSLVVVLVIPNRRGIGAKMSAVQNVQITISPGDILAPRSVGDSLASFRA
jgi:hypothetical protein